MRFKDMEELIIYFQDNAESWDNFSWAKELVKVHAAKMRGCKCNKAKKEQNVINLYNAMAFSLQHNNELATILKKNMDVDILVLKVNNNDLVL